MDYLQLFHHGAAMVSIALTVSLGHSGTDCVVGLWIAELANPNMYLRYLLWCLGLGESQVGWVGG